MARDEEEETGGAGAGGESTLPQPSPSRGGSNVIPFAPVRATRAYRPRHDGFTPARRKLFFKVLRKTGCIADAARACGISRNTVRRWRSRWKEFDDQVEAALAIASVALDTIAWKRATEGAEEKVYRDGRLVFTRVKPSDSMLRLLMQGANPKKYGRTGRMPKKAVMKKLRKEVEAEVRAGLRCSKAELIAALTKQLDVLARRRARAAADAAALPPPDDA